MVKSRSTVRTFDGWRAVGAAFIVAVFGWGTGFYGPPVYLELVHQLRGWSISLISGAVTLHFLVGVALIPCLPTLYRRLGVTMIVVSGAIVMGCGVVGWAIASAPWQLYVAAALTGIGWSALGAVTVNAIVSPWFLVKRPMALGVAFNGGSVGGVIFSPLWVALVDHLGFFIAALLVAIAMVATIGGLGIRILRNTPEASGQALDGVAAVVVGGSRNEAAETTAERLKPLRLSQSRAFVSLCAGMTFALFAQTGVVAHLVSILAPALGRQGAGLAAGACGVTAVIGRLVVGRRSASARGWRTIASWSLAAQALGCGVMLVARSDAPVLLVTGVVLFGLGVGNAISVPPVIANLEFDREDASRAVALIVGISQGAYAIAPAAFGVLREHASNRMMFLVAIGVQLAAIIAYAAGKRSALGATSSCAA